MTDSLKNDLDNTAEQFLKLHRNERVWMGFYERTRPQFTVRNMDDVTLLYEIISEDLKLLGQTYNDNILRVDTSSYYRQESQYGFDVIENMKFLGIPSSLRKKLYLFCVVSPFLYYGYDRSRWGMITGQDDNYSSYEGKYLYYVCKDIMNKVNISKEDFTYILGALLVAVESKSKQYPKDLSDMLEQTVRKMLFEVYRALSLKSLKRDKYEKVEPDLKKPEKVMKPMSWKTGEEHDESVCKYEKYKEDVEKYKHGLLLTNKNKELRKEFDFKINQEKPELFNTLEKIVTALRNLDVTKTVRESYPLGGSAVSDYFDINKSPFRLDVLKKELESYNVAEKNIEKRTLQRLYENYFDPTHSKYSGDVKDSTTRCLALFLECNSWKDYCRNTTDEDGEAMHEDFSSIISEPIEEVTDG